MIVFDLVCSNGHHFEGWFACGDAFEQQLEDRLVTCPFCNDMHIRRRPSASYVNTGRHSTAHDDDSRAQEPFPPQNQAYFVEAFMALLREAGRSSEDVGEAFAEEARRIHYGETPHRKIKGQASPHDIVELLEEGIQALPLPLPKEDLH